MASKPSNPAKPTPAAQPAAKGDSKPVETAKPPVKGEDKPAAVAKKKTPARARVAKKASDEAKPVVAQTAAPAAKAAAPAQAVVETAAKTIQQSMNKEPLVMTTIEDTVTKTQAMFGEFNARAQAQFEKNAKLAEEAGSFAKGNVEALVESGKITAKGWEALAQDAADFTRKSFDKATATLKEAGAAKSPADLFKLQSDFVREQFDAMVAVTSKNTEALVKLAGDAAQPISSRYAVAVEKVKTAA